MLPWYLGPTEFLAGPRTSGNSPMLGGRVNSVAIARAATVVAVLLGAVSGLPAAAAEPISMPPKSYDKTSRDGWQLNILLDQESVNSVPNLANAKESREGFVTLSATATATGGDSQITDSLFIVGYQLGCQTDVSTGVQYGGSGGASPLLDLGDFGLGVAGGLSGFVQTVLQPGVIVDPPLPNMALNKGGQAMIDIDNIHVKADACGGDVTLRSYGYLRISTDAAHTQFAIYGDPIKI